MTHTFMHMLSQPCKYLLSQPSMYLLSRHIAYIVCVNWSCVKSAASRHAEAASYIPFTYVCFLFCTYLRSTPHLVRSRLIV